MRFPLNILTIPVFLLLTIVCSGQNLKHYNYLKVKAGSSVTIAVESIDYPTFLKTAKHGVASKIKLNFESQYRIKYTPQSGFLGVDTVVYKTSRKIQGKIVPHFEGFIVDVQDVLAVSDFASMDLGDGSLVVNVLDNDQYQEEQGFIRELIYISKGTAVISQDQKSVIYSPSGTGYATVTYLTCAGDQCSSANVTIHIYDQSLQPRSDSTHYRIRKDGSKILLLPPDFAAPPSRYFKGDLLQVGENQYLYSAPLGFTGTEDLRFQQIYNGELVIQEFVIDVFDPFDVNGWTSTDLVYTERNNEIEISVLANDLTDGEITLNLDGLIGELSEISEGNYLYRPPTDFQGQTRFQYEVCKEGRCDVESVYVTVFDFRPMYDAWNLYTSQDVPLEMKYEVPIDDFHFSLTSTPSNGTLTFDPDGQSMVYQPNQGFVGTDGWSLNYCTDNDGHLTCEELIMSIQIQNEISPNDCFSGCVWEGDLNNDGIVDMGDLLPLGSNMGIAGPSSLMGISSGWSGRSSTSWSGRRSIGSPDLKYVDSDGDGLIRYSDHSGIQDFYGMSHTIVASPAPAMESIPVSIELLTPFVSEGEEAAVQIAIGSSDRNISGLLGVDFSLELNERFVDSSSFSFVLSENGLFHHTGEAITYGISPQDGRFDVGVAAIGQEAISGHGVLGEIRFIVEEDLNGFRSLKDLFKIDVFVDRMRMLQQNGTYSGLGGTKGSFVFQLNESTKQEKLTYYPNPAQSFVTINGNSSDISNIYITNLQGQTVHSEKISQIIDQTSVDISALVPGTYLLIAILDDGTRIVEKLQIVTE